LALSESPRETLLDRLTMMAAEGSPAFNILLGTRLQEESVLCARHQRVVQVRASVVLFLRLAARNVDSALECMDELCDVIGDLGEAGLDSADIQQIQQIVKGMQDPDTRSYFSGLLEDDQSIFERFPALDVLMPHDEEPCQECRCVARDTSEDWVIGFVVGSYRAAVDDAAGGNFVEN